MEPVIKFMKDEFDLTYTEEGIAQLQGIENLKSKIKKLNSYSLTSLYFTSWFSNSLPLGIALLYDNISIDDAMRFDYIDFLDPQNLEIKIDKYDFSEIE